MIPWEGPASMMVLLALASPSPAAPSGTDTAWAIVLSAAGPSDIGP
jgi:hypothetical protein